MHLNGDKSGITLHNGYRDWMRYGITFTHNKDFMYVGPKKNGDLLRFVFTAAPGNGLASTNDGFELARMWVDGQDNGRMGIGDFFTAGTQPQNTLEIMASQGSPYWHQSGGTIAFFAAAPERR